MLDILLCVNCTSFKYNLKKIVHVALPCPQAKLMRMAFKASVCLDSWVTTVPVSYTVAAEDFA